MSFRVLPAADPEGGWVLQDEYGDIWVACSLHSYADGWRNRAEKPDDDRPYTPDEIGAHHREWGPINGWPPLDAE